MTPSLDPEYVSFLSPRQVMTSSPRIIFLEQELLLGNLHTSADELPELQESGFWSFFFPP